MAETRKRTPNLGVHVPTKREKELETENRNLKMSRDSYKADRDDLSIEKEKLELRNASQETTIRTIIGAKTELEKEVNNLRSRLMASELAYAKLRGYLDRVVDEQPPVMVPREREPMHAQMPDGTRGTEYSGWHGGDSHRDRRWFHK